MKAIKLLLILYFIFQAINVSQAGEYPKSASDFKTLPRWCHARMNRTKKTDEFWNKRLSSTFGNGHHYCAAMHSFQHAEGMIPAKEPKTYWLGRVIDNIEYMESHDKNKAHKIYAQMYLFKARAYLMQKQIGQAFIYFEKSLAVNPKYTPTYREQIRYFLSLNDKKSALELVNRGLTHKPKSKSLLRIKSELAGN